MKKTLMISLQIFILALFLTACAATEKTTPSVAPTGTPTAAEPTNSPTPTEIPATPTPSVDESKYLYINKEIAGKTSLTVDVSGMAGYQTGAVYQVTFLHDDGTVTAEDITESEGKIQLTLDKMTAVEVSPVFHFVFGKQKADIPSDAINALATMKYENDALFGFDGAVENQTGSVHLKGSIPYFALTVPDGFYNIDLIKGGTGRSSIIVNGATLGCNVGIQGAGGRKGITPYEYYMEDACITGGNLRISMGEKDWDLAALTIRRSTTLSPRKTHLYLAGDSTASAYFPIEKEEPAAGRFQTGWGQLLCQFVSSDVAITNLGAGGTYAKSWYEAAFSGITQHAQPGDYFIIMEGINDQSYSNVEEMVEYLTIMIDACREKGVIPVLCTAMQSVKFWKDDKGNDVGEFECPLGSGKVPFMEGIRKLAQDKGVFLIDVGAITSTQYGTLGRTFVMTNYHLYDSIKENAEDTLHLSYAGAKNVASIIATELNRLQTLGTKDSTGAQIKGIPFNPLGSFEITYTDKNGTQAVYSDERVTAVYRTYGVR